MSASKLSLSQCLIAVVMTLSVNACTQSSSSETEAHSPDKATSPQVVTSQTGTTNISASDQLELKTKNLSSTVVITVNGIKVEIVTLGDGTVTIKLPAEVLAAIKAATSESVALDIQVYASESDYFSKSNASTATVSVAKSSAVASPTPTNTAVPAATATTASGSASISTLTSSPASVSVKVRGTASLTLTAGYSDGTSATVTSSSTCVSSNTAVATISSGVVTGKKVGSATITCLKSGVSKDIAVTVAAANMIIQWGGWQKSGYGLYDSTGTLLSTLVNDSPTLDRRGMFAVSGGFYSVGTNPNNSTQFTEFLNNDGSSNGSHAIMQNGAWMSGPQAMFMANDGRFLIPQYNTNSVEVFAADGSHLTSFGSANLSGPYWAGQFANGKIVVTSWNGKLVAFTQSGSTYTYDSDFATGFTNPFGADYCAASDTILFNDFSGKKVYSCTSAGACTVLANHGLTSGRGMRVDINAGDCSFFLNYDAGSNVYKIAKFNADGTLNNATWATMPGGINRIFGIEFVID